MFKKHPKNDFYEVSITVNKRIVGMSRCECQAKLKIKFDRDKSKWFVLNFVEGHNHEMTSSSQRHYMRNKHSILPVTQRLLKSMSVANIPVVKQAVMLGNESGGYDKIGFTYRDILNMNASGRYEIEGYDADLVLEHLESQKKEDKSFYYAYQKNEQSKLSHLFWADGTCQENFKHFGEAVTFDTTYCTNRYSMIFGAFCGVNHHRQTIFFGMGLLNDETISSFNCLFLEFKNCMGGEPAAIVTDQDPAMNSSLAQVYPGTIHRFCTWHIMDKLQKKIGGVKNKGNVIQAIHDCVWYTENIKDFECSWRKIIIENELDDSKWLKLLFEIREKWVPAYMQNIFFAGMKTTQRSESMNAFLKTYIMRQNTLFEFLCRFEVALKHQRENENMWDYNDNNKKGELLTEWKLEAEMEEIYTRSIFHIFQKELKKSFMCNITIENKDEDSITYNVSKIDEDNGMMQVKFKGIYNVPECDCHFMEFQGLPCQHSLAVFKHLGYKKMSPINILTQWRKRINDRFHESNMNGTNKATISDKVTHIMRLCNELISIAGKHESATELVEQKLESALLDAKNAIKEINEGDKQKTRTCEREIQVHQPDKAKTKGSGKGGRPKLSSNRIQSDLEKKRSKSHRQCKTCMQYSEHDSRTCPIRKDKKTVIHEDTSKC